MKKGSSLSGWYKRIFLSERTTIVFALLSIFSIPFVFFLGMRSNAMDLAGYFELILRLILVITLFYAMCKHNLLLMQGASVGLLSVMLCGQSAYALGDLFTRASVIYITMGLNGFVFLAREMMILFLLTFVSVNHFVIYAVRRQEKMRLSLNQYAILILLGFLIVQLLAAPGLSFERNYILYVLLLHANELFVFTLVACAELTLMIDKDEFAGG